jgi:hypothetical protein
MEENNEVKKKLKLKKSVKITIVIILLLLLSPIILYNFLLSKPSNDSNTIMFDVEAGSSVYSIGTKLKKEGLIRSELAYKIYVKLNNIDGVTKTGKMPTSYSDPNDVENYNIGKIYIMSSQTSDSYSVGDIFTIASIGGNEYSYIRIAYGSDYIGKLSQAIVEIDEDILKLKTRTDSLEKNDESQDYTLLTHTEELLQISTIIELLNKEGFYYGEFIKQYIKE